MTHLKVLHILCKAYITFHKSLNWHFIQRWNVEQISWGTVYISSNNVDCIYASFEILSNNFQWKKCQARVRLKASHAGGIRPFWKSYAVALLLSIGFLSFWTCDGSILNQKRFVACRSAHRSVCVVCLLHDLRTVPNTFIFSVVRLTSAEHCGCICSLPVLREHAAITEAFLYHSGA